LAETPTEQILVVMFVADLYEVGAFEFDAFYGLGASAAFLAVGLG